MTLLLITNCTNRKRRGAGPLLQVPDAENLDLEAFAAQWWEDARGHPMQLLPCELYCGRGYQEALSAAATAAAPLYTVSAGFGLVGPDDQIPPYDFTLTNLARQQRGAPPPQAWWRAINATRGRPQPIRDLLETHPGSIGLIAMSGGYLAMVANELLSLSSHLVERLRIVTASPSLPSSLARVTMPYDARLDGPDSTLAGTKADFASRAARHFVENIWQQDPRASAENHAQQVHAALAQWSAPDSVARIRATDEEIRSMIVQFWNDASGSSTRMLRLLRDRERVACEQGRFAQLFRQVKGLRSC